MCNHLRRSLLALSILALSCVSIFAQSTAETEGWQLVRGEDGVDLYIKAGENGARIYKGVATLDAQLPEVATQLMEVENYKTWMQFDNIEILGTERDGSTNLYMQALTPSLAANRDLVSNLIFSQSEDAVIARFTNRPTLKPETEGFIRIPVFSGFIIARQGADEVCKFTLQCEIEFGGNIPAAVMDYQMKKFISESVKTFSQELRNMVVRGNEK